MLESSYRVATFSRKSTSELEKLRSDHRTELTHLTGDMADSASLTRVVGTVEKTIGPIDVLINNAGIAHDGVLAGMPPEQIERLIQVNLTGSLLLSRLVVRRMLLRNVGNIINISSIIGSARILRLGRVQRDEGRNGRHDTGAGAGVGIPKHPSERDRARIPGDRDDARLERLSA